MLTEEVEGVGEEDLEGVAVLLDPGVLGRMGVSGRIGVSTSMTAEEWTALNNGPGVVFEDPASLAVSSRAIVRIGVLGSPFSAATLLWICELDVAGAGLSSFGIRLSSLIDGT